MNQDNDYTSHLKYVNSLHNQVGLLPNMMPGERKEAYSVTKSAIAPGMIDVENFKMDVSQINRDINHSLQALDTIFNKQDIQERQELTKLFNKYANEAIHHISDMAGWKEGSSEKVALHAIVGNISANMVNGNARVGTAAGGLSELLAQGILEASNGDPAKAQWLAYALGYATDKLLGGTGELGGSISHYGVKWNAISVMAVDDDFNEFYKSKENEELEYETNYMKHYDPVPNLPRRDKKYYRDLARIADHIAPGMGAYLDMATRNDYENQIKYDDRGVVLVNERTYSISPYSEIGKVITQSDLYRQVINEAYAKTKEFSSPGLTKMYKFNIDFSAIEKAYNFALYLTAGKVEGRIQAYTYPNGTIRLKIFTMDNSNYETSNSQYIILKNLVNEAANAMYEKELVPYTWFIEEDVYI